MYSFSIGALIFGLLILAVGGAMVAFHQKIADNLAGGVSSYDRVKLWGLIVCGIGIIIMMSLHTIPLNWLVQSLFGGRF
jgi:hypothetical protein